MHDSHPEASVRINRSGLDAHKALQNACEDLEDKEFHGKRSKVGTVISALAAGVGLPVISDVPTVLREMFGGDSEAVRQYKARLEKIGGIEDRFKRIRRVYELATSSQGSYGREYTVGTPGKVIDRAHDGEAGGRRSGFGACGAPERSAARSPPACRLFRSKRSLDIEAAR